MAGAELPIYVSQDWSRPLPGVTRAVIIMHGLNRNADGYYAALRQAATHASAGAETLLLAPQVLADEDIAAHHLPPTLLHWHYNRWAGGAEADGPAPVSPFAAFDAILARLADRRLFPDMQEIVVAGHSAGGQVVHRYAVLGRGDALPGIRVRYVVANPSSYVWFGPERPVPGTCPNHDAWRYGLAARLPGYADAAPAVLEARYRARDVTYLLGTRDTNPQHSQLDKSCEAELQGPTRYARGHAYMDHLHARGALPTQREWDVAGVGHDGPGMMNAPCGLAALFGVPGCPGVARP